MQCSDDSTCLAFLSGLELDYNGLYGTFPECIGALTKLQSVRQVVVVRKDSVFMWVCCFAVTAQNAGCVCKWIRGHTAICCW